MNKINMVDLQGQYKKIKSEIDSAIHEVLDSAAFINGPAVKEFQAKLENYLGVKH
ncbi:MAG: transcriptional regulator, partial [Bacteroidetes bacterium]|nr:transcriptional regulator [Bacteroidota bacterium]